MADRVAVFVDAGFLVAEAGGLCCETKVRSEVDVRYDALITKLTDLVTEDWRDPDLRLLVRDARARAPDLDRLRRRR